MTELDLLRDLSGSAYKIFCVMRVLAKQGEGDRVRLSRTDFEDITEYAPRTVAKGIDEVIRYGNGSLVKVEDTTKRIKCFIINKQFL